PLAVLLLRVLLRGTAGAGAGEEVRAGGASVRAEVLGDAVGRRVEAAARAGGGAGGGRDRPGVLGPGAEVARRNGGRGGGAGGGVSATTCGCGRIACPHGSQSVAVGYQTAGRRSGSKTGVAVGAASATGLP